MFQPPANPSNSPINDGWGVMRLGKFGVRYPPTGPEGEDWAIDRVLTSDEEWANKEKGGKPQDIELFVSADPSVNKLEHVYGRYVMFHTLSTRCTGCTSSQRGNGGGLCALEYIEIL